MFRGNIFWKIDSRDQNKYKGWYRNMLRLI